MNPLHQDLTCKHVVLKRELVPRDVPDGHLVVFCESGTGCEKRGSGSTIRGRALATNNVEEFDAGLIDRLATAEEITHAQLLASNSN